MEYFKTLMFDTISLGLAICFVLSSIKPCICKVVGVNDETFKLHRPVGQFVGGCFKSLPRFVADTSRILNLFLGDGLKITNELLQFQLKTLYVQRLHTQRIML